MDKTAIVDIVYRYADAVWKEYEYNKLYLFGSYAKGNFNKDSDIDLAFVFNDYEDLLQMQWELMRIRRNIDSRIEPHPFREKDFTLADPLVYEILQFGKEIKKQPV